MPQVSSQQTLEKSEIMPFGMLVAVEAKDSTPSLGCVKSSSAPVEHDND